MRGRMLQLKKVVIEVPDENDIVLSITAIGGDSLGQLRVVSEAFDLNKGEYIKLYRNEDGELKVIQN